MKTIETKVYTFDELSDEAKERALNWMLTVSYDDDYHVTDLCEDAKNIGLNIIQLDDYKSNKGAFITSALSCANSIVAEHGDTCETYKTAKNFLKEVAAIEYPEDSEDSEDLREAQDNEFLHTLLEDYRIMLNKENEYRSSREYLTDNILANEYTFTEDGKRFG